MADETMGTEVWVLTRTLTDNYGTILSQNTSLYSDYDAMRLNFRDIIDALICDYDSDHDRLEIAPLSASLYYGNGGTDYTTVRRMWIV